MVKFKQPFLIVKYATTFLEVTNNTYEVVTLGSKKLRYFPIDRSDALLAIHKFDLPLLHKVDNRNMVWGDERFKERYHKLGLKL
jgi:hypothetical protein